MTSPFSNLSPTGRFSLFPTHPVSASTATFPSASTSLLMASAGSILKLITDDYQANLYSALPRSDPSKSTFIRMMKRISMEQDGKKFAFTCYAYHVLSDLDRRTKYDENAVAYYMQDQKLWSFDTLKEIYVDVLRQDEESSNNDDSVRKKPVWAEYAVKSIGFGSPHPGHVVEASNLSEISLPQAKYPLRDSLNLQIENKTLSKMQLEGIMFAAQRHQTFLDDNETRAGFYLGDSAGVGKGRQLSGILLDNLLRGRKKHVWFSVSKDLYLDATRDLNDIGCSVQIVRSIPDLENLSGENRKKPTVLFSTYTMLIGKGSQSSFGSRFGDLVDWLCDGKPANEFDGVLLFDEAHKAKNFREGDPDSTQVGNKITELQTLLPRARVVYSSATCVSSVEDMGYMTRLGYWGEGTRYGSFKQFSGFVSEAGVSGMELVAMDMKANGKALVRNVSYEGAEFILIHSQLNAQHARIYNAACEFWVDLFRAMLKAKRQCMNENSEEEEGQTEEERDRKTIKLTAYWASHQRFFAQLILAIKVDDVVREAKEALNLGMCAVIGLQSTGEAALAREVDAADGLDNVDGVVMGHRGPLVSSCRSIAELLLSNHFNIQRDSTCATWDNTFPFYQPSAVELMTVMGGVLRFRFMKSNAPPQVRSKITQKIFDFTFDEEAFAKVTWPMYRADGTVVDAMQVRGRFFSRLGKLELPPSAIDDLIDKLGGPNKVAEMTGRHLRQIRDESMENSFFVEKRHKSSPSAAFASVEKDMETESINIQERKLFQGGKKLIAIISEAASTGVSLHADRRVENQRRRVHITIQLPWAADQAIQQLGRSHRTNQTSAPMYRLISSGLGGEHRFVSSVAKRLQTLGAITQGDRRASLGSMSLGEFLFESIYGVNAVMAIHECNGTAKDTKMIAGIDYLKIVSSARAMYELEKSSLSPTQNEQNEGPVDIQSEEDFLAYVYDCVTRLDFNGKLPFGKEVSRFLNRILGLSFYRQAIMFQYFSDVLEYLIEEDKKLGLFDHGLMAVLGREVIVTKTEVVLSDARGRRLVADHVRVDRGNTFYEFMNELAYRVLVAKEVRSATKETAEKFDITTPNSKLEKVLNDVKEWNLGSFGLLKPGPSRPTTKDLLIVFGVNIITPGSKKLYLCRPYLADGSLSIPRKTFVDQYTPTWDVEKIKTMWTEAFESINMHNLRFFKVILLSGSVVPYMGMLSEFQRRLLAGGGGLAPAARQKKEKKILLRSFAVQLTNENRRIVGVEWEENKMKELRQFAQAQEKVASMYKIKTQLSMHVQEFKLGFEINEDAVVVSIQPSLSNPNIRVGHRLWDFAGFRILPREEGPFLNLDALIRFYRDKAQNSQFVIKHMTAGEVVVHAPITLLMPSTEQLKPMEQAIVPVVDHLMETLVFDAKKQKKLQEKRRRESKKLMGSDDEEENEILKIAKSASREKEEKQKKRARESMSSAGSAVGSVRKSSKRHLDDFSTMGAMSSGGGGSAAAASAAAAANSGAVVASAASSNSSSTAADRYDKDYMPDELKYLLDSPVQKVSAKPKPAASVKPSATSSNVVVITDDDDDDIVVVHILDSDED